MNWRLAIVWFVILVAVRVQMRYLPAHIPFDDNASRRNLDILRHNRKPPLSGQYYEQTLDDALAAWNLQGPIYAALPPMYADEIFGNAGFLSSFVNHGDAILYNGPFPHPKLAIAEHFAGPSSAAPYVFDNRASNAVLLYSVGGDLFPYGMTGWYDLVLSKWTVRMKNPRVLDHAGRPMHATRVRAVHKLNEVYLGDDEVSIDLRHHSPIVWTYPGAGHLDPKETGFTSEAISDGIEVSWMPPLPPASDRPFGMFLLSPLLVPTDDYAPAWWRLDERLRRAIVGGRPVAEKRPLFEQLAREYPTHPLLDHYRVVKELGGASFDRTWLEAQSARCQLSTWYLVAWTHVPWSRLTKLPCLAKLPKGPLRPVDEYIAEWAVIAHRERRDDPELLALADRVVDATFLRREFRGFNFPPSNYVWLWLKARP